MNKKDVLIILVIVALAFIDVCLYVRRPLISSVKESSVFRQIGSAVSNKSETGGKQSKEENAKESKAAPPTSPKKQVKVSSCVVLDEKYCHSAKPIYDKNGKLIGLGFSIPDKTPIYAPFDGFADYPIGSEIYPNAYYEGLSVEQRPIVRIFNAVGAVDSTIEKGKNISMYPISKGEKIGEVDLSRRERIVTPDQNNQYVLMFNFQRYNSSDGSFSNDLERYKKYFGYINYKK